MLLSIPREDADVFRKGIDVVYEKHGTASDERDAYDNVFELFVAAMLATHGRIGILDEQTGEERFPIAVQ